MSEEWPAGYEEHRREQIQRIARATTPTERAQWLEDLLFLLWRNGLIPSKLDGMKRKPGEAKDR